MSLDEKHNATALPRGAASSSPEKTLLVLGALLHDVGKVVYRGTSERATHSKLGADFVREFAFRRNEPDDDAAVDKIAEQVRFHHASDLSSASSLSEDSLAFITYFADNISAGMDRKGEGDSDQAASLDREVLLRKIFNILNGHSDQNTVGHEGYDRIRERLKEYLSQIPISWNQVNSVLNLLEATTSSIPSSTNLSELVDVSLFDHSKTTAAIASCVYEFLQEKGMHDYRATLFDRNTAPDLYRANLFLLYFFDMSGIQSFIYSISGSGALKQLRARSMYLELLLEHVADELLESLRLSRANLLYLGGGHAYFLLPNTAVAKDRLARFEANLNAWLVSRYRNDLYVAAAWEECSADDLSNKPVQGEANPQRYRNLFSNLAKALSDRKACRYSAQELFNFNFIAEDLADHSRECTECHRSDSNINEEGKCPLCAALGAISKKLVDGEVFLVSDESNEPNGLPLPFGKNLVVCTKDEYQNRSPEPVRIYTKNDWDMEIGLSTHIWMGDYAAKTKSGEDLSSYARHGVTLMHRAVHAHEGTPRSADPAPTAPDGGKALGINRLGVLRADIDNLGSVFVNGIPDEKVSIRAYRTKSVSGA